MPPIRVPNLRSSLLSHIASFRDLGPAATLPLRLFTSSPSFDRFQLHKTTKNRSKMATTTTTLKGQPLDKAVLDSMLRRRLFYTPSFEIYGGVGGLYDYGPPGCALQANIVEIWRKHFILEEDMLEVDCTVLTPHDVLKTSGHVDKFADWMCKDPKNGDILRADHFVEDMLEQRLKGNKEARGEVIAEKEADPKKKKKKAGKVEVVKLEDAVVQEYEEVLAKIDNYSGNELGELIKKYDLKNPTTGVQPSPPVAFNLMFQTAIGPSSNLPGYLRPETAQGQFLNFSKLLEFNQQQMPFASASIGRSYRNEISPRAGLLRVREFLMAEIEHFVDPHGGKKHARFHEVENVELVLLDRHTQLSGKTSVQKIAISEAVKTKLVDNETLGYFLARIHLFMSKIGIDQSKIRFRQHMANEMAHYATDCWDCELLTSSGWVECVGCADRSAYDLTVHAKRTGAPLVVRERLDEPVIVEEWEVTIEKKKFGPHFTKNAKAVEDAILATTQEQREALAKQLKEKGSISIEVANVGDGKVEINKDLIKIEFIRRTENTREYTPNVIEPSFGIGRILYSLIEHNYWTRASDGGDEARGVSVPYPREDLGMAEKIYRFFPSHLLSHRSKSWSCPCRRTRSSSPSPIRFARSSERWVSRTESTRHQLQLASDTAATMNSAHHLASPSTSRPSRMARSRLEIGIRLSRSERRRTRSSPPFNPLLKARSSGRTLKRNFQLSRARRSKSPIDEPVDELESFYAKNSYS
jgi:glycyl-tRNA synthetase